MRACPIQGDTGRDPGRLSELDAMRGIAAFAVVLSHAVESLRNQDPSLAGLSRILDATPFRVIGDGRHAVIFFFVLSGLVLTRTMLPDRIPALSAYIPRRILRLCLPAAAALLFSFVLWHLCVGESAGANETAWLADAGWTRIPSFGEVIRQTLLIGVDGDFYLDGVLWSLVHELRMSVFLPLIVAWVAKRDPRGGTLLLVAGGVLFGIGIGVHGTRGVASDDATVAAAIRSLINFLLPVAIFAWVAMRTDLPRTLSEAAAGTHASKLLLLILAALTGLLFSWQIADGGRVMLGRSAADSFLATLYFLPSFLVGVALSFGAMRSLAARPERRIYCVLGGVLLLSSDNPFATVAASALLIVAAQQPGGLRTMLRTAPLLFLGRISFSLYLVHFPVLLALSHALYGVLPDAAINALSIALSVPAAWVLHRVAEQPAQRLARRIGRSPAVAHA